MHCDLKPSNLLLDESGGVRVTDFGFALLQRDASGREGIGGTPGFMAPEQLDPSWGEISPRTDVFGLGAVLFALLTGAAPFAAANQRSADGQRLLEQAAPSPRSLRADVDEAVDAICRRCLSSRIEDRYATAAALGEAMATALAARAEWRM